MALRLNDANASSGATNVSLLQYRVVLGLQTSGETTDKNKDPPLQV